MNRSVILILLIISVAFCTGCKKNKLPTTAELNVTCVALEGHSVDLSDLRAELHTNATYESLKYHFQIKGTAATSTGQLTEIEPGRYFLVVWKDIDSNQKFSKGDFFGFYPHALNLKAGDNPSLTIEMYIIE